MRVTPSIIVLFLSLICTSEAIIAQDSFNTQLLFESVQTDGEFIDVIVKEDYVYAIVGPYLKIYELLNDSTLNYKSQIHIYSKDASPAKVLKYGNKLVVLFHSGIFPNNNPGGIKIFEIDANFNIKFLSDYNISGFKHDFTLTDKYIFVAAGESGLYIIDYQNPTSPITVGRYNPGGYSTGNGIINISINGNIASVSMAWEGLDIIDISNVAQPQKLFSMYQVGEGVNATILNEEFLYVFLQNSSSCEIYNILNLQNVKLVSSIATTQTIRDVSISENYLFISENGTQIEWKQVQV